MESNVKNVNEVTTPEKIKAKRGRKSKKDLMTSLNVGLIKEKMQNTINLTVSEIQNDKTDNQINDIVYNIDLVENNSSNIINNENPDNGTLILEEPKIAKKRGRKPKGGKIVQQSATNITQKEEKSNVILHLKCSMKDLQTTTQNNTSVETCVFLGNKNNLNYDVIVNENIDTTNMYNKITTIAPLETCDDYEDETVCKDSTKEVWKKLKQLEHNLHINNINNKRSACFWDTCEFDNPPIYIPKHYINGTYHVYGCFCSPECGVAYLMNETLDSSTKFERYHLLNHIYAKIYNYKKNIKPAPNPHYMLEKYYGNLSIQEYRSLLMNERLFLIVDKPLTRILPELHEDNDDFILNNKIIPSNNYQLKTKLQKKKQNKNLTLNEKFGASAQIH